MQGQKFSESKIAQFCAAERDGAYAIVCQLLTATKGWPYAASIVSVWWLHNAISLSLLGRINNRAASANH
jgi:hypothetical protein